MKKPLVDHIWSRMSGTEIGPEVVKQKLAELDQIERRIRDAIGDDVRNILADGTIHHALERMGEIHSGSSNLDEKDLHIYHDYATSAAKKAEQIIDDELSHLGL